MSPDGQYQNQIGYILCGLRWRCSIQSAKTRLGANCDSDHDLLIAKFKLEQKKVGKTTRPFRYALNKIPFDQTMEVTNRFRGLDLIECLKRDDGWGVMTFYRRQESKPSPRKISIKKGKWLSEEALQIAEKKEKLKAKDS